MGEAPRCDVGRGPGNRHRAQVQSQAGFQQSGAGPRTTLDGLPGDAGRASDQHTPRLGAGAEASGAMPATLRHDTSRAAGHARHPRGQLGSGCGEAPTPCRTMCPALPACMCHPGRQHRARCRVTASSVRASVARGASARRRASGNRHRASGDRRHPAGQLVQRCVGKATCFGPCGTTLRPRSCEPPATTRCAARHHVMWCPTTCGGLPANTRRAPCHHQGHFGAPPGGLLDTIRVTAAEHARDCSPTPDGLRASSCSTACSSQPGC